MEKSESYKNTSLVQRSFCDGEQQRWTDWQSVPPYRYWRGPTDLTIHKETSLSEAGGSGQNARRQAMTWGYRIVKQPLVIQKKSGDLHFCFDYRKMNVTSKDSSHLHKINDTLDSLAWAKWFSTLDLKSAYWQVELHLKITRRWHSQQVKGYGNSQLWLSASKMFQWHLNG